MARKILYDNYHRLAKLQKRVIGENNFTYRNLLEILRKHRNGKNKILDIGCGVGTLDFYLASKRKDVTGIDVSKNAIDLARANAKKLGLNGKTRFLRIDFPKSAPKGKFDLIICSEVLEHLRDDKKAIKKIFSLLIKNGLAIISVPSKNAPLHRLGLLRKFDKKVGHLRRYYQGELEALLKSVGFETIYTKRTEGILRNFLFTNAVVGKLTRLIRGPLSDFVTFVDNLTILLFGESQIYIVVRK